MRRLFALLLVLVPGVANAEFSAESGKIIVRPDPKSTEIPPEFRLVAGEFPYHLKPARELPVSEVEVYSLTFPSPVKSPYEVNNTVHAHYFRPKGDGPFPALILLEVLSGSEEAFKAIGLYLAQNKIATLFLRMAYYGPRRPPGQKVRLLSTDIDQTVAAVRQTILDCRVATEWLATRPEVNPERLGILGISLGSFVGALTASAEPRLQKVALLLGGGSLVDSYYDHPKAAPFRALNSVLGGSKAKLKELIAPVDPITYAPLLGKHDLLIIAASRDDIVPPIAAEYLWKATGQQKIVWIDTNHYGAVLYLLPMMRHVIDHFQKPTHSRP